MFCVSVCLWCFPYVFVHFAWRFTFAVSLSWALSSLLWANGVGVFYEIWNSILWNSYSSSFFLLFRGPRTWLRVIRTFDMQAAYVCQHINSIEIFFLKKEREKKSCNLNEKKCFCRIFPSPFCIWMVSLTRTGGINTRRTKKATKYGRTNKQLK